MEKSINLEAAALDSLPRDLRVIANVIGINGAIKIAKKFGGGVLLIPKCERLIKTVRNERLRKDFDIKGMSVPQLVRKYNLSTRSIYDILKGSQQAIPDSLIEVMEKEGLI